MPAILVEFEPFDPVEGVAKLLRATDTDDSRVASGLDGKAWLPALIDAGRHSADAFAPAFPGFAASPSLSVSLDLAAFPDAGRYGWADRPARVWVGEAGQPWPWAQRFTGLVESANARNGRLEIRLRVDDAWLDRPLLTSLYAGTGGIEGGAELKGLPRPLAIGAPRYVQPVLIDVVDQIYQFHGYGAARAVLAATDRLVRFPASVGDYANYAALKAAAIPAGRFGTCRAAGLVRFGAPPEGPMTLLVQGDEGGPAGWVRTPGAVIRRLALLAGARADQIDTDSLAALDAAVPYPISLYIAAQRRVGDAIAEVAASCNAMAMIGPHGKLMVTRAAIGAPVITVATDGSAEPQAMAAELLEQGAPWWRLQMEADRCWRPHSYGEIAYTATLVARGEYAAGETYREGNIVSHNGSSWIYTNPTPSSGNAPPSPAYWELLAAAGAGEPGPAGAGAYNLIQSASGHYDLSVPGRIVKASGHTGWNAMWRTASPHAGGVRAEWAAGVVGNLILGLTTAEPTDTNPQNVFDYGVYINNDGGLIRRVGSSSPLTILPGGSIMTGDRLTLAYDGQAARAWHNGALVDTFASIAAGQTYHVGGTSISGGTIEDLAIAVAGTAGAKGDPGDPGEPGPAGPPGGEPIYVEISRSDATVFGYSNGKVPDFAATAGKLTLIDNGVDVTSSAVLTAAGVHVAGTIDGGGNYIVTGMDLDQGVGRLMLSAAYGGETYVATLHVTKVRTGLEPVSALPVADLFEGREVYLETEGRRYIVRDGVWEPYLTSAAIEHEGDILESVIDDIFEIYGDTESAALSAAAADAARTAANNARDAAIDARNLADSHATNAGNSAAAAAGHVATASSKATEAGNHATAAQGWAVTADAAATDALMQGGNQHFTFGTDGWADGTVNAVNKIPTSHYTYASSYSGAQDVLVFAETRAELISWKAYPVQPGRTYRIANRFGIGGSGVDDVRMYAGVQCIGADGNTVGGNNGRIYNLVGGALFPSGWHAFEAEFTTATLNPGTTSVRLQGRSNFDYAADRGGAWDYFTIADVTEEVAALGHANASASHASAADASKTAAGNSASAANTSRVEAEAARDTASGHASAASTSASNASASATTAGNHATAANTARTQAETARSQAEIARTDAVGAKEDAEGAAASALSSMTLSASLALNSAVKNPAFANWPDGQAMPASWSKSSGGVPTRVAGSVSPYALQLTGPAGGESWLTQTFGSPADRTVLPDQWWVLEADVTLVSGTFEAAAAMLRTRNAAQAILHQYILTFKTDPDSTGSVVGDGVPGNRYRFSRLFRLNAAAHHYAELFGFSHYAPFGDIAAANAIKWHMLSARPATQAEIDGHATSAEVSVQAGAIATLQGENVAYWQASAGINGDTNWFMQGRARGAYGQPATGTIGMGADKLYIYNPAGGGSWVKTLEVSAGLVRVYGRMAANTVDADAIIGGSVEAGHLAATNVVTMSAQIGNGVIQSANIGNLQVKTANIEDLTVGTEKVQYNAISAPWTVSA